MKIKIISNATGEVFAEIQKSRNPKTAAAVLKSLPVESQANRWGDEVYLSIPLEVEVENAQEKVEVGDLAYWPQGPALCIFFGPTPASKGDEPRAASNVNVLGKVQDPPTIFGKVKSGDKIRIEKVE